MIFPHLADCPEVLLIESLNLFEVLVLPLAHLHAPVENAQAKRCSDIP